MTTNVAAIRPHAVATPSKQYLAFLSRNRRDKRLVITVQVVILALFLGLWEVLPRAHVINPMLTSYPSAIWEALVELLVNGSLLHHTWSTVFATIIGFTMSMVIGVVVAAALWWSDFAYKVLDPFLVVANALPKIALVPIFYIWLGSDYSIYGIAIAIAVFVAIMIIYAGFRGIDANKIKLATTFGATRWQVLCKVVLPGSVPTLIAALKMNIGLALVGVVVGEFQSSNAGLGFLIINGSQIFKMNIVMAAVSMLAVISCVMYAAIYYLEATVSRRYA